MHQYTVELRFSISWIITVIIYFIFWWFTLLVAVVPMCITILVNQQKSFHSYLHNLSILYKIAVKLCTRNCTLKPDLSSKKQKNNNKKKKAKVSQSLLAMGQWGFDVQFILGIAFERLNLSLSLHSLFLP